jgi:TPR repeat protein
LLVLPVILAALAALLIGNWWHHRREEPFRAAVAILKREHNSEAWATVRRFARDGHHGARLLVAETYARGIGVLADPVQATIWYRRAECACGTTGESEYHLAKTYLEGQYGSGKKAEALRWLQRAADAGNEGAQRLLAEPAPLTAQGVLVPEKVSDYWRRILSEH